MTIKLKLDVTAEDLAENLGAHLEHLEAARSTGTVPQPVARAIPAALRRAIAAEAEADRLDAALAAEQAEVSRLTSELDELKRVLTV